MRLPTLARGSRLAILPILCALVWLAPAASAQPVDADRITLRVAAGQYEIVAVTPLTTVLTPSETATGQSGFWVELQASDGSTLYRRILDDPSRLAFEGPELVRSATRSAPSEIRLMGLRSAQKERKAYAGPLAISRSADIDRGATSTRMQTMSTPSRDEAIAAERVFTVLVPRAQTGDEIVFFGPPASVGTQAEEAGELARIPVSAPAPEVGNE